MTTLRLGDMLVRAGVVTEQQLQAGVDEQQRLGGKLGGILVRMGLLSEKLLVMALSRQMQVPTVDLEMVLDIPDELRVRLNRGLCERYRVLPLAFVPGGQAVQLAMSDPFDIDAIEELRRRLGVKIEPFLAGEDAIAAAIRRLFPSAGPSAAPAPQTHQLGATIDAADVSAQVERQARVVHAVAELLMERGIAQPEDFRRR